MTEVNSEKQWLQDAELLGLMCPELAEGISGMCNSVCLMDLIEAVEELKEAADWLFRTLSGDFVYAYRIVPEGTDRGEDIPEGTRLYCGNIIRALQKALEEYEGQPEDFGDCTVDVVYGVGLRVKYVSEDRFGMTLDETVPARSIQLRGTVKSLFPQWEILLEWREAGEGQDGAAESKPEG